MGAKQSKRSVDISGKEGDAAGEVAAAGAGGEGRVEQLADADALKPQLNGDAHVHEPTDKEKELDSGTPENEKDATTEKENKEKEEEKEATPITNGDGEQKTENGCGDSAPTPEDGKKPKKEKVKKKWSLRSISFSRKDKPKQEKKQKEEEPKTNGEPEKVPEETAESSPEPVVSEEAEEVKTPVDAKDEKAPDTPVTEPITNGSSTPESPKLEIPAAEETVAVMPEEDKAEVKTEPEIELPVNGLSLEESKQDIPEIENKIEEIIGSKPEETPVETTEVIPVPEIPVTKEVCVEQVPLIEPTPPPLPANPPPSSVASFAATTMAPELTDASLSNTTETAVPAQSSATDNNTSFSDNCSEPPTNLTNVTATTDVLTTLSNETKENKLIGNLEAETESKITVETFTDTLEINVETKKNESQVPAPEETLKEASLVKIENKIDECQITPNLCDTGEISIDASESEVLNESEAKKVDYQVNETIETKPEVEASQNVSVSKEVIEDSTEVLLKIGENETKETLANSAALDLNLPSKDTEEVGSAEVISTVLDENIKEDFETQEKMPFTPETNTKLGPLVVTEPVDVVELPPPPPVVHHEVDKRDEAMDESNDTDAQETINSTNEVDCNDTKTSIVADPEAIDTQNIEVVNKVLEEDNINTCKDPVGDIIANQECNGNVDNINTPKENISAATDDVLPLAGNVITPNIEPEKEVAITDDSLPPSLSETKESMPAAQAGSVEECESIPLPRSQEPSPPASPAHSPQDALPENVNDKIAELITDVSPVPELKTEMETSSDVAVAN